MSLENTGYCKKEKSPCDNLQGDRENSEIGATRFELDAKDPQKQGLFNDGGNLPPHFSPHQNYFEQILSFFDSLEPSEQESLLDALKERVKAAK